MDPVLPLAALLAGLWALSKGDEKAPITSQPTFTGGAERMLTETRTVDGVSIRYFRSDVAAALLQSFAAKGLEGVEIQGGTTPGGALFRLAPMGKGVSARDACVSANSQGLIVLATLSAALDDKSIDALVMFAAPNLRVLASPSGSFAVLLDTAQAVTTTPGNPTSPYDYNLPPELARKVASALADKNATPESLESMADTLESGGYPIAAKALRDRAAAIRMKQELDDKEAGGTPFVIRTGDLPYRLSQYYTGDANRWREILSVNSQLGMHVTSKGWVEPWIVGSTILMPLSWNIRSKPLPAPATGTVKPEKGTDKPPKTDKVDTTGKPTPEDYAAAEKEYERTHPPGTAQLTPKGKKDFIEKTAQGNATLRQYAQNKAEQDKANA